MASETCQERRKIQIMEAEVYNVRKNNDNSTCDISGCCKLENGLIVLGDWANSKLKLFHENFQMCGEHHLPGHPWHMCKTARNAFAVSVNDGFPFEGNMNEVHLFELKNGIIDLCEKLSFGHPCCGIACTQSLLYVGTRRAIFVYSMAGELIQKVYEDSNPLSDTVWKFALNKEETRIYIPKLSTNQVITTSYEGDLLSTFQMSNRLKFPSAICALPSGDILVAGIHPNTILQLDDMGRTLISVLATSSNGINQPKSLWFHKQTQELIVGQNCDSVVKFKLRMPDDECPSPER